MFSAIQSGASYISSSFRKPTMVMSLGAISLGTLWLSSFVSTVGAPSGLVEQNAKDICEAFFTTSMSGIQNNATYIFNFQPNIVNYGVCDFDEVVNTVDLNPESNALLAALMPFISHILNSMHESLSHAAKEIYSAYFKNYFRNVIFGLADYAGAICGAFGLKWLGTAFFLPGQQMIEFRKWLFSQRETREVMPKVPNHETLLAALADKLATLEGASVYSSGDSVVIESKELADCFREFQKRKLESLQQAHESKHIQISDRPSLALQ